MMVSRGISILYVVVFLLSCLPCGTMADPEVATYFFDRAHSYAKEGDLKMALANFRTAVRHNNESEILWNDLGVTEMRMGDHVNARRHFIRSLQINPEYTVAQDNLSDVSQYLKSLGHKLETENTVLQRTLFMYRHKVKPVSELSGLEFNNKLRDTLTCSGSSIGEDNQCSVNSFTLFSEPFIVRQFLQQNDNQQNRDLNDINVPLIQSVYGNSRVDYYPQNMDKESSHPFFLSMGAALDQLSAPREVFPTVDVSEGGTYIQWNLDLPSFRSVVENFHVSIPFILGDENIWSKTCFSGNEQLLSHFYLRHHWKMLLIGAERAGMFLHQDLLRASSYQIQLAGSKRWHLCAGNQSRFLYNPGDVNLFHPDYAAFPKVKRVECYEVVVQPGDLIFYPGDYWHQTYNHDTPTISLSSTVVMPRDVTELTNELNRQCDQQAKTAPPSDSSELNYYQLEAEVCRILTSKCFEEWKKMLLVEQGL